MTDRGRIWEIDYLRGTALVLMIIYHSLFNLHEFYGYPVSYSSGFFFYMGKGSAILFILISAVSSAFSRNNIRRAIKFLIIAMLITIGSHLYNPDYGIKFGIIHFLGISILLYPFFRDLHKYVLVVLGTVMIMLGRYLAPVPIQHNYLFLFNLQSSSWISADYYPLFPWLGVFLYGISLGKTFYSQKKSLFNFTPRRNILGFIGQHTLFVYLIHQPLLLLMIGIYVKLKR